MAPVSYFPTIFSSLQLDYPEYATESHNSNVENVLTENVRTSNARGKSVDQENISGEKQIKTVESLCRCIIV